MALTDDSGRTVALGERLGAGGEGVIHAVVGEPGLAAKCYHQPTAAKAAKLQAMITHPPQGPDRHVAICWPQRLLLEDDAVVGFLMPRIDLKDHVPVARLYNPLDRSRLAPGITWGHLLMVAANMAAVVEAVHASGHVIGDLSETNLLVSSRSLVTLVDCDSMQVGAPDRTFRCVVGRPELTPPELLGQDFTQTDRTAAQDCFALGVLIFQVLMEGVHPYAGVWQEDGEAPTLAERIREGYWPYTPGSGVQPPPAAPPLAILPRVLQGLMRACFEDRDKPQDRPTARQWREALTAAYGAQVRCKDHLSHVYSGDLLDCPWCQRMQQLRGLDPFPQVARSSPLTQLRHWITRTGRASPRVVRLAACVALLLSVGSLPHPRALVAASPKPVREEPERPRVSAQEAVSSKHPVLESRKGRVTELSDHGWPVVDGVPRPIAGMGGIFPAQRPAFRKFLRKQGDHLSCKPDALSPGRHNCALDGGGSLAVAAIQMGAAEALPCASGGADPQGLCQHMQEAVTLGRGHWKRADEVPGTPHPPGAPCACAQGQTGTHHRTAPGHEGADSARKGLSP